MEGINDGFKEGNDLILAGREMNYQMNYGGEMNYQTISNFQYSTYLCTDIIKVVYKLPQTLEIHSNTFMYQRNKKKC